MNSVSNVNDVIWKDYVIRHETPEDYREVEILTREAFWDVYMPGCSEHLVIHQLRDSDNFIKELDYVVTDDSKIVGSIVYSKSYIVGDDGKRTEVISFGPLSVHPACQKTGIGKKLIEFTLQEAKILGYKAVAITGSEEYYGRMGFEPASRYGMHLEGMSKDDPAPFFMVKELEDGFLEKCNGGICAFDSLFEIEEERLAEFDRNFTQKSKRKPREGDL